MGAEVPGAGGRRAARAVGGAGRRLLRQGLRRDLPRPRRARRRPSGAQETDRFSLAAMFVLAALCLLAGILPGFVHRRAGAGGAEPGRRPHAGAARRRWLSIVPIAESRSSYNGLLVFLFIAISGIARRLRDPPLRLATRCAAAPAWDCGFPDPSPATQYTAGSFAQPIRRVFGTARVPRARDGRDAAARRHRGRRGSRSSCAISIWDALYAPVAARRRLRRRPAQPPAVPDHPPATSAWSSPRWSLLLLVLAIWP